METAAEPAPASDLVEDENRSPNGVPMSPTGSARTANGKGVAASSAEAAARAREARFLASQSARTAERRSRAAAAAVGCDDGVASDQQQRLRSEFWVQFRSRCSDLSRRVDSLLSGGEEEYVTASQRAGGRAELDSVLTSVRELERHCLGASPSSSAASPCQDCGEGEGSGDLPPVPDHLPQGDVRMIGEEIVKLTDKVNEARDVVCPPELFVFRRYRALMERRAKGEENGGIDRAALEEKDSRDANAKAERSGHVAEKEELEMQYGTSLRDMSNCSLAVEADGTVTKSPLRMVPSENESETKNDVASSDASPASASASSLLIKDLCQCNVVLKGTYQSIHIINADRTTIKAIPSSPVSGPVHVTACQGTTISVACRQLRIHDCTDVTFRVHVRSGPIIENCSGMVFLGDYYRGGAGDCENMFRDVKDFNWLRSLVKSPNFVVIEERDNDEEMQAPKVSVDCGEGGAAVPTTGPGEALEERNGEVSPEIGGDESDDEDEL